MQRDLEVHLITDPADSVTVQRAIQGLHAPRYGSIVITPTAGTHSGGILLRDILLSLGLQPYGHWDRLTDGMRTATIDVLRKARIRDLYVVRANHLDSRCWHLLRIVATHAQLRLWLVVHRERPVRSQLNMLIGCAIEWHRPPKGHVARRGLREWRSQPPLRVAATRGPARADTVSAPPPRRLTPTEMESRIAGLLLGSDTHGAGD